MTVRKPSDVARVRCEAPDCVVDFEPKRSTARFCSTTCRSRAARARKAAEHQVVEESKTDSPGEHGLVKAVRLELEKAEAVLTVPGQLALQVARRIVEPEATGVGTLSKELRALLAEATGSKPPPGGDEPAASERDEEDDDVTRARRKRDEARQAAGLA